MIKGLEKLKESNKIARYKRKIFVHQGKYIWLVIGGVERLLYALPLRSVFNYICKREIVEKSDLRCAQ
jgi:hypothetical protein